MLARAGVPVAATATSNVWPPSSSRTVVPPSSASRTAPARDAVAPSRRRCRRGRRARRRALPHHPGRVSSARPRSAKVQAAARPGPVNLDDAPRRHPPAARWRATDARAPGRVAADAGTTSCCPTTCATRCASSSRACATAAHVLEQWGFRAQAGQRRAASPRCSPARPAPARRWSPALIARELGLELYRVDLSRIVSKWIGETEKNLARAVRRRRGRPRACCCSTRPTRCSRKRTEVKSSQRSLREPRGQLPAAAPRARSRASRSSRPTSDGSIDPAFKRRLAFRVDVPVPRRGERDELWRAHAARAVPTSPATSTSASSPQRFQLSGGYIRNAVLRAAFLAAAENARLLDASPRARRAPRVSAMGKVIHSASSL